MCRHRMKKGVKMGKGTKSAFGAVPFGPPPKKKLAVRKLMPPPQVRHRIIEKDKDRAHPNPIIRFFKKFFGEGF